MENGSPWGVDPIDTPGCWSTRTRIPLTKPMKPMVQTDLSRYDQRRTVQHNSPIPAEDGVTTEGSERDHPIELTPDETVILDYIEKNTHVLKSELQHRSGLPTELLDEILESLENMGVIQISTGYTVVQIQSQQHSGKSSE